MHNDLTLRFPPTMSEPISPTYTSYSVPSPFSSGSSASYPNHSPISEAFDSVSDPEPIMDDYPIGYHPHMPVYSELGYISPAAVQDFDYNMMAWSPSDIPAPAKRQPPQQQQQQQPQQQQQYPSYRNNLALYIPPSPQAGYQNSPTVIHSPVPIPVPSHVSHVPHFRSHSHSHSHSLSPHSPPNTHFQPFSNPGRVQPPAEDRFFDVDVDINDWHPSPTTTTHFPSSYPHAHSQVHSQSYTDHPLRRTVSEYTPASRIKQEDAEVYANPQAHIFDLSCKSPTAPAQMQNHSPHLQHQPAPHYYPHEQQQRYTAPAAYPSEQQQQIYTPSAATYAYAAVCNPQYVSGAVDCEKAAPRWEDAQERKWGAEQGYVQLEQVQEPEPALHADVDADAEGEEDTEVLSPVPASRQPPLTADDADGHEPEAEHHSYQEGEEEQGVDDEYEVIESEESEEDDDDDDARDPEFVLRRARRCYPTSSSTSSPTHAISSDAAYPHPRRATRFTPYPSRPSPPRRGSYAHDSVSPAASSAGSGRRASIGGCGRARAGSGLPVPVPVPNLTKKSRGRRVPTMEDFVGEDIPRSTRKRAASGSRGRVAAAKGMRTYTCEVEGCGKLFARGEHLKRHVRSIHTYEKPHMCPYPGCGKDFSRHDNLGQHMRVHKDYMPPKEAGLAAYMRL